MKSLRLERFAITAIAVLAAIGFAENLRTPQGVDDWVWYLVALVLSMFVGGCALPFLLAGLFSALTLIGYKLSPTGPNPSQALLNCWLGVAVLWITAGLLCFQSRMSAALRHTEQRYRSLFENMQEGVAQFRILYANGAIDDLLYIDFNRAYTQLIGIKIVAGKRLTEVIPSIKQTRPEFFELIDRVARTGKPESIEYELARGAVWVNINVYSMDRDNVVVTYEDITARKAALETLREQALLLDKASDAILVLDSAHRICFWNRRAEAIYGWSAAEAVGKTPLELFYGGEMTSALQECIATVDQRGEWTGELEELSKDGRRLTIQGRGTALYDDKGKRKGVLIINTDITERKKLELQFLRAQRMESVGTLAAGIAHDLNNVLAPLMMAVQLLKERQTDRDDAQLLQMLDDNVKRGANLVKQVLTFGRGIEGERMPVNLRHLIHEVRQIIRESFPKSVVFEAFFARDLWTITGDSTQLHQVLLNLCINARDAMPNGGNLTLEAANFVKSETSLGVRGDLPPGNYVLIKLTDTGTGMSKELQERIFEPFFTTKPTGIGTGLGLSTSLGIIKGHGGVIHCYSELGSGTTFAIYFPASGAPPPERVAANASDTSRGNGELILVIDDEYLIRHLTETVLTAHGYRVLLASNGAQGVDLYARNQSDISAVITDVAMPVMDGPTAIRQILALNPKARIIATSGLSTYAALEHSNAPVRHFIPKPCTANSLLHTVRDCLREDHQDKSENEK